MVLEYCQNGLPSVQCQVLQRCLFQVVVEAAQDDPQDKRRDWPLYCDPQNYVFYLAHQATYHGQVKIGAPLTVAIEQPAIDGRGIMRFAHGSTIDGRFENGAPVPYSFKYFSGDFDGAGDTQMIYSGHYNKSWQVHGDGMRTYANGDFFIGRWSKDYRAEGAMTQSQGHAVFDGIVENGVMVKGTTRYRRKYITGPLKPIEPYGIPVPDYQEIETDVWEVDYLPSNYTFGPGKITFANGDVFECVFGPGGCNEAEPHKLTRADGTVCTSTIPAECRLGHKKTRTETVVRADNGDECTLVQYFYS